MFFDIWMLLFRMVSRHWTMYNAIFRCAHSMVCAVGTQALSQKRMLHLQVQSSCRCICWTRFGKQTTVIAVFVKVFLFLFSYIHFSFIFHFVLSKIHLFLCAKRILCDRSFDILTLLKCSLNKDDNLLHIAYFFSVSLNILFFSSLFSLHYIIFWWFESPSF